MSLKLGKILITGEAGFIGSHLTEVLIENKNEVVVLDILKNEKKYPFLIKEFDSNEFDFNYVVKMYKIDYNIFEET